MAVLAWLLAVLTFILLVIHVAFGHHLDVEDRLRRLEQSVGDYFRIG